MGYWIGAVTLVILNAAFVFTNVLMLPGNWLMVASLSIFLLSVGSATGPDAIGPDWTTLLIVIVLAVLGEIVENVWGAAKASALGGSRRAAVLSLVLSMIGSIAGAFMIPIPIVGNAVGAILGAAGGAFVGAWLGEAWKGKSTAERTEIGAAALTGRMLGMAAKLGVGVAIFVVQLISLWT